MSSKYFKSAAANDEYPVALYLAAVAQVIRVVGFDKASCKSDALALVIRSRDEGYYFLPEDFDTATKAMAWLLTKEQTTLFERSILEAVSGEFLPVSKGNLVMYLIKSYLDAKDNEEFVGFIGKIGDKVNLTVRIISTCRSTSEFGEAFYTRGVTSDGKAVAFYVKSELCGTVNVSAKVKAHNTVSGAHVTYINYVKVV